MSDSPSPILQIDAVAVHHDGMRAVDGLSLALVPGELACLLGPSGCGKTTLLRAVAGLHQVAAGRIVLRGQETDRPGWQQPAEARRLGMVFQDLALFPHFSVRGNLELPLRHAPRAERRARVEQLLADFQLDGLAERRPDQLSGGQQQRVALARALAAQTDLVLLDEPFSSLDARLKAQMNRWLRGRLKAYGAAALLVSHDQEEALVFADRIGVMHGGRLLQWGTPREVYQQPLDRRVAEFLGESQLLPATRRGQGRWHCALGEVELPVGAAEPADGLLLVRPEHLWLDPAAALRGQVIHGEYRGARTLYRIALPDGLELLVDSEDGGLADGSEVGVSLRRNVASLLAA